MTVVTLATTNIIYPATSTAVYSNYSVEPEREYRDAYRVVQDVFDDARRWMRGSFPPPVELELAALPEPPPAPPAEAAWTRDASGRVIARVRRRRPLRGRAGRPHAEA